MREIFNNATTKPIMIPIKIETTVNWSVKIMASKKTPRVSINVLKKCEKLGNRNNILLSIILVLSLYLLQSISC